MMEINIFLALTVRNKSICFQLFSEKMSETGPEDDGKLKKKSNDNRNGEKPGYCDCCSLRFKELKKVDFLIKNFALLALYLYYFHFYLSLLFFENCLIKQPVSRKNKTIDKVVWGFLVIVRLLKSVSNGISTERIFFCHIINFSFIFFLPASSK